MTPVTPVPPVPPVTPRTAEPSNGKDHIIFTHRKKIMERFKRVKIYVYFLNIIKIYTICVYEGEIFTNNITSPPLPLLIVQPTFPFHNCDSTEARFQERL